MTQYRKKPVVIDAIQWTGENESEIAAFVDGYGVNLHFYYPELVCKIPTLEGDMLANVGDWIIRGIKGEHYPCKPDIFAATYDPV